MHIYTHTRTHTYRRGLRHVYACIHMYTRVCMHTHVYTCMHAFTCIHTWMHAHTHIYANTGQTATRRAHQQGRNLSKHVRRQVVILTRRTAYHDYGASWAGGGERENGESQGACVCVYACLKCLCSAPTSTVEEDRERMARVCVHVSVRVMDMCAWSFLFLSCLRPLGACVPMHVWMCICMCAYAVCAYVYTHSFIQIHIYAHTYIHSYQAEVDARVRSKKLPANMRARDDFSDGGSSERREPASDNEREDAEERSSRPTSGAYSSKNWEEIVQVFLCMCADLCVCFVHVYMSMHTHMFVYAMIMYVYVCICMYRTGSGARLCINVSLSAQTKRTNMPYAP